jgi:hypothetical protein
MGIDESQKKWIDADPQLYHGPATSAEVHQPWSPPVEKTALGKPHDD